MGFARNDTIRTPQRALGSSSSAANRRHWQVEHRQNANSTIVLPRAPGAKGVAKHSRAPAEDAAGEQAPRRQPYKSRVRVAALSPMCQRSASNPPVPAAVICSWLNRFILRFASSLACQRSVFPLCVRPHARKRRQQQPEPRRLKGSRSPVLAA